MMQSVGIGTGPNGPINQLQGSFAGMKIVVSRAALEETEERLFPESKHRSKRIHKKLMKRFGGEFVKQPAVFQSGNTLIMHPVRYAELEQELKNQFSA